MIIKSVSYRNFGPFESAEWKIGSGITVVEGEVKWDKNYDSNGAGKTFLLCGISYALYGECGGGGPDSVIRRGASGAMVSVSIVDDSRVIVVERYRKDPKFGSRSRLLVGGKDVSQGTSTATDEQIVRILGVSLDEFNNSTAFGLNPHLRWFTSAGDTDRKRIFDSLLNLGVWSIAMLVAKERLAKLVSDKEAVESSKLRYESTAEEKRRALKEFERVGMRDLERDLGVAEHDMERAKARAKEAHLIFDHIQGDVASTRAEFESELSEWNSVVTENSRQRSIMQSELARCEADLQSEQAKEKRISAAMKKGVCGLCGTDLSDVAKKKYGAELEKVSVAIDALLMEVQLRSHNLKSLPQNPPKPVNYELESLLRSMESADARKCQASEKSAIATAVVVELRKRIAGNKAAIASMESALGECEASLKSVNDELRKLASMKSLLEFWVEGFGPGGIRSLVIENSLHSLNERCAEISSRLLGDGAVVQISPTTALKGGGERERLNILVDIPGCAESYERCSKGQKRRVDLCILLALRGLRSGSSGRGFGQIFIDELFDGLDRAGVDCVMRLLRDMAKDFSIVLITHDSRLKGVADQIVRVVHDGKRATLATK